MKVYLDASFLVSLYSPDINSLAAARTLRRSDEPFVTSLAELEVVNAFQLRVFRKEITALQSETSLQDFTLDLRVGVFRGCSIPANSFLRALQISRLTTSQLGTRSADLLHVAAALDLGCGRLYSFDERQRKLAQTVKLKLNPVS